MKKIISSPRGVVISAFGLLLFTALYIVAIIYFCNDTFEKNIQLVMCIMSSMICLPIIFLLLFMLNCWGCTVWYDGENIGRKGLIAGYKYQISVDDIKSIEIHFVPKDGEYIIFKDNICSSIEGFSNKSYIRLQKDDKRLDFAKQIKISKSK